MKKKKPIIPRREKASGEMRLNKYIANCGICSRREADKLIEKGQIKVNGKTVTEMGVIVGKNDEVKYRNKVISPKKYVYYMMNKPKNTLSTLKDPEKRRTVMDIMKNLTHERVYPVGRLDRNTTGVLILTNDGELANKLSHPSKKVYKVYNVTTDRKVLKGDIDKMMEGFELEDGFIKADAAEYFRNTPGNRVVITLHSGRNRIVRRMFTELGYKVTALDRIRFGSITKKGLPRGTVRVLDEKEVNVLHMM